MTEAPLEVRFTLAITLFVSAVLCGLLSVPLIRGRVPMNRWYGVRMGKAFESDSHWYALNRYGGWQLLGYSVALAVAAVLVALLPISPERWYFWPLMLSPLWLLVPVLWRTMAYSNRLP